MQRRLRRGGESIEGLVELALGGCDCLGHIAWDVDAGKEDMRAGRKSDCWVNARRHASTCR